MGVFGEPEDVPGECNAHLRIGDNFGDNHATMRCRLSPGHSGNHREQFQRGSGQVTIEWELDEKQPLCECGRHFVNDSSTTGLCFSCQWEKSPLCASCGEEPTGSQEDLLCAICESKSASAVAELTAEAEKLGLYEEQELCPKCKKRPAQINDGDDGLGPPVCCDCHESGLPDEPVA